MSVQIEREYRTVDKSAWGDGPWSDEPDKVQWTDPATGLPCLALRGPFGAWCGYVGVPRSHRLYGVHYSSDTPALEGVCTCGESYCHPSPDHLFEVHGSLTFSDACSHGPEDSSICHIPQAGQSDDIWWFGWDCAHYRDLAPGMSVLSDTYSFESEIYRDLAYVQRECAGLARQLWQLEGITIER